MITFETIIKKFGEHGEKTGWTYIDVPAKIAEKLKPGCKKSFRVRGKIDEHILNQVALIPIGEGNFIMGVNAIIRKGIGKRKGAKVTMMLEEDDSAIKMNSDFVDCLADEPEAKTFFNSLAQGHKNYFSKWIDAAKTDATKTNRIAAAVKALSRQMDYGQMIREMQKERKILRS